MHEYEVNLQLVVEAQRDALHALTDENLMLKALVHQQQLQLQQLRGAIDAQNEDREEAGKASQER